MSAAQPQAPARGRTQPSGATAAPAGGSAAGSGIATAILLATAPADEGGPAAALALEGPTILGRLLGQLDDLGLGDVHVITRPDWAAELEAIAAGAGPGVRVEASPDIASDARLVADIAGAAEGGLMVAYGDLVTHREALAGLLADPRVASGILTGRRRLLTFRVRSARGRIVSAASPYHAADRPSGTFLGVLKVSAADRETLARGARHLEALLTGGPPEAWEDELERKAANWRTAHDEEREDDARAGAAGEEPLAPLEAEEDADEEDEPALREPIDEAEVARRLAVVREDVASLLVVALVRSGTHLTASYLRRLFWSRPVSRQALAEATEKLAGYDEDRVLLDSAVKGRDGFFTTFFVSPYSKYLARWAARRGLTPNQITTVSLLIGVLAAAAFATGERTGLVAGAILLQLSFTTDCVDGQLARYTRQFSKLGAWLDSIFDRSKEYAVFAGLAIGASSAGDPVWVLAGAALILQTTRHTVDFSFAAKQHHRIGATRQPPLEDPGGPPWMAAARAGTLVPKTAAPDGAPAAPERKPLTLRSLPVRVLRSWRVLDRLPGLPWVKRMVAFPIGERFAAISLTAALFDARTTFTVLLVWGGFAFAYTLAGRLLRSVS